MNLLELFFLLWVIVNFTIGLMLIVQPTKKAKL